MTQRQYAKRRAVHPSAVAQAIAAGRISLGEDGLIDAESADAAWERTAAPPRGRRKRAPTLGDGSGAAGYDDPGPSEPGGSDKTPSYFESRARREKWQADRAELDYKVAAGKLVDADVVRQTAYRAAKAARDLLLALPDRLAPLVTGLAEQTEVHRLVALEVRRVCDELSKPITFRAIEEPKAENAPAKRRKTTRGARVKARGR